MDKFFVISRTNKDFSYRDEFHIVKQKDFLRFLFSRDFKKLLHEYRMGEDLTIRITYGMVISFERLLNADLDSLHYFFIESKSSNSVMLVNKYVVDNLENSKLVVFEVSNEGAEVALLSKNNLKNNIADFFHENLRAYGFFEEDCRDFRWICRPANGNPRIAYFDDVPFDEYLKGEYEDIYLSDKHLGCYFNDYELYCPPDLEVE